MSALNDVLDALRAPFVGGFDVVDRQNQQWDIANKSLEAAGEALTAEEPDHLAAIAYALTGLLAERLSRR